MLEVWQGSLLHDFSCVPRLLCLLSFTFTITFRYHIVCLCERTGDQVTWFACFTSARKLLQRLVQWQSSTWSGSPTQGKEPSLLNWRLLTSLKVCTCTTLPVAVKLLPPLKSQKRCLKPDELSVHIAWKAIPSHHEIFLAFRCLSVCLSVLVATCL